MHARAGTSLIEVLIGIMMVMVLFGGIYIFHTAVLQVVTNTDFRTAATALLNRQVEIIRGLPYASVGTVGGIPSGILPPTQTVSSTEGATFLLTTTIRNIDDPFDGLAPTDTAPADYKLVQLQMQCLSCVGFVPLSLTTWVAPKNLESASNQGSLFVNVFDANGNPVSGATVNVINTSTTPTINLTDTTNLNGVLQLVGVPTSTQSYHVSVTKAGYTTAQNYPFGIPSNPNPSPGYATVSAGTLTPVSFQIDRVSPLTVMTEGPTCVPIANQSFSYQGAKLIGSSPNVLKFATSTKTGSGGTYMNPNLEWDNYVFTYGGSSYDLVGATPSLSLSISPSTTVSFAFILLPTSPNSLSVTVKDAASGASVPSATVNISQGASVWSHTTDHAFVTQTDWSGGQFSGQSNTDTTSVPGALRMAPAGGPFSTTTVSWLISNTIDLGSSSSSLYYLSWGPGSAPPSTGQGSVEFQVAANNDNATWNFVGPSGAGSYFTASSSVIGGLFDGNRYLRYKVFLKTQDSATTPEVDDVTFDFSGPCVPPGQALFQGLSTGSYGVNVTAAGFAYATSTVSVGNGWQGTEIDLTH